MPNLDAFKPLPVTRFAGAVDYQTRQGFPKDATKVISGCAILSENNRFSEDQVSTRYGTATTMEKQQAGSVTGIDVLNVIGQVNPGQQPFVFDDMGHLFRESPAGSGALVPVNSPVPLPVSARMQTSQTGNRFYAAFSNGSKGLVQPIVIDGRTGNVQPVSQNPIGALWLKGAFYLAGDLVRSADGRWWQCYISANKPAGATPPSWPKFNGYFNPVGGAWTPANASDLVGGSAWTEWTPNCANLLPAPDLAHFTSFAVSHKPGAGSIPAGQDVYIKLTFLTTSSGEGPRSTVITYINTAHNDQISVTFGTAGTLNVPRWIAEMLLRPAYFHSLSMNTWVAAVPTGSAPPPDSAYNYYGALNFSQLLIVIDIPAPATTFKQGAGIPIQITAAQPTAFMGQNGTRYMIVLRQDTQGSFVPVDPGSPIPISLQGQITANILTITRNSGGTVEATVTDITGFAVGQQVQIQGCTGDVTFNGSFILTAVQGTLAPEGLLTWIDAGHASNSSDSTGVVQLPAGSVPVAFLPAGGTGDLLDIAAFTVVNEDAGGPFFYVAAAQPTPPVVATIVSLQGTAEINAPITTITRVAGGETTVAVNNINGFVPGMPVRINAVSADASLNEETVLSTVEPDPSGGFGGTLGYTSAGTGATSGSDGTISAIVAPGSVQAVVTSAVGLAAGQVVAIVGSSNPDFNNQLATISSIVLNVATLSLAIVGASTGGQLIVQQALPTTSPSGVQNITGISRDFAGNVTAQIDNLAGWAAGHLVNVTGAVDGSFNGIFEVVSATLNLDGLSGVLTWVQTGHAQTTQPAGGTVTSCPDIIVNYDDTLLTSEADNEVTDQLSSNGAPIASDLCWIPSFGMMAYTTGLDDKFYFSQQGDPANISGPSGAETVSDRKMSLAVAVRELESGEVLAIKTDGGYSINVSDLPPGQWNAPRRWDKFGPPCAAAIGLGYDFIAFPSAGEEAGAYLYKSGSPIEHISKEYQQTWNRVNWSAGATFYTEVDDKAKRIHFGVALDDATSPSHELVLSYESGWEFPEVLNRYGKLITARACRKWSTWPISAKTAKVVNRTLTAPYSGAILVKALPSDSRYNTRQFLRGINQGTTASPFNSYNITLIRRTLGVVSAIVDVSGGVLSPSQSITIAGVADPSFNGQFTVAGAMDNGDGTSTITWAQALPDSASGGGAVKTQIQLMRVTMEQADRYDDDGVGYISPYLPAFSQDEVATTILRFGGMRGQVDGVGTLVLTPTTEVEYPEVVYPNMTIKLLGDKPTRFERGFRITNEFLSILFNTDGAPGSWYTLQKYILYGNPYQAGRRSA